MHPNDLWDKSTAPRLCGLRFKSIVKRCQVNARLRFPHQRIIKEWNALPYVSALLLYFATHLVKASILHLYIVVAIRQLNIFIGRRVFYIISYKQCTRVSVLHIFSSLRYIFYRIFFAQKNSSIFQNMNLSLL